MTKNLVAIDIDSVPVGPELNALVAVHIFGYAALSKEEIIEDPEMEYSTDANDVRVVEAEIERRGLWEQYVTYLILEVFPDGLWWGGDIDYKEMIFPLINATPEQRCRAALGVARQRLQELLDG